MTEGDKLLKQYRAALVGMHDARDEEDSAPRKWNRRVDRMQSLQLRLRRTPEGRAGITAMALDDECATVRDWAAAHALFWDEPVVRPMLEALTADESSERGFAATMLLREFDAGRLNMTWTPKRK